ncbi:hypothetical protein FF36_03915 [Frankia torreyi]|uniref:Uncharacterized protein n=1 Tax=Frankia torreyi TaxID=1856 RepID=A0A0D8BC25_9ACTN|nr:hypothetical protein FF36_03915 [Frankia torreyi]KQM01707.1 hypothetical protein FF86_11253 [Frankia sp. CpI1-P]
MPMIRPADPDFRVCQISFEVLLGIQLEAERRGWATRWTSVDALRAQVKDDTVFLQSLMREERSGVVRSYRCLVLFRTPSGAESGAITTIDLAPETLASLDRLDVDVVTCGVFMKIFSMALGGISQISKE